MTRIPEQPALSAEDTKLQLSLTPILGEHAREINRTLPADQALAFTFFMS